MSSNRTYKPRKGMARQRGSYKRTSNLAKARGRIVHTQGFLQPETKFYDTAKQATALASSTSEAGGEQDPNGLLTISAPAQGDSEQNRDGNRIVVTSAFLTGTVRVAPVANLTAGLTAAAYCVYLVQDTQTNGVQLNSEDVFVNPSSSTTLSANPLRNLQYSSRFKVLAKATGVMQEQTLSYDGTNMEAHGLEQTFMLSWKGAMPVQFKGGSAAAGIAGVSDNSLHIIAFSNAIALPITLAYNARIRFQG